jgi:hypothetical protein
MELSAETTVDERESAVIDIGKFTFGIDFTRGDFRIIAAIGILGNALHNRFAPCPGEHLAILVERLAIGADAESIVTHRKGVGNGLEQACFDQSPDWRPREIPLGDGRTLILEDS